MVEDVGAEVPVAIWTDEEGPPAVVGVLELPLLALDPILPSPVRS